MEMNYSLWLKSAGGIEMLIVLQMPMINSSNGLPWESELLNGSKKPMTNSGK